MNTLQGLAVNKFLQAHTDCSIILKAGKDGKMDLFVMKDKTELVHVVSDPSWPVGNSDPLYNSVDGALIHLTGILAENSKLGI